MSGGQQAWATLCVVQVVGSEHVPGVGTCSARRLQRRLTGELALAHLPPMLLFASSLIMKTPAWKTVVYTATCNKEENLGNFLGAILF